MNFFKNNAVAVIALVVAIIGCYLPLQAAVSHRVAGVTNYDELDATALKIGGSSGSRIDLVSTGSCSLVSNAYTVAATSSAVMSCAIPGLVSGDTVIASLGTSTVATNVPGWEIMGAIASTTASGFAEIRIANFTGASAVVPANLGSSTSYTAISTRSTVPGL